MQWRKKKTSHRKFCLSTADWHEMSSRLVHVKLSSSSSSRKLDLQSCVAIWCFKNGLASDSTIWESKEHLYLWKCEWVGLSFSCNLSFLMYEQLSLILWITILVSVYSQFNFSTPYKNTCGNANLLHPEELLMFSGVC